MELLDDMPGNGLPLAIRVSGEIELISLFDCARNLSQSLFPALVDRPLHVEVFVRLYRTILRWQIAHVAVASQDFKVLAQVLVDGLGFGGGFDDDDVHTCYL